MGCQEAHYHHDYCNQQLSTGSEEVLDISVGSQ